MSFSSLSSLSQNCVNFVTYNFNRQDFDQLIQMYFEDETTCPFTYIKKTRFGYYKPSTDEKKNKINGIKGFLKIDKIHFEPVGSEPDSIRYCKKTFNKYSIHNRKEVEYDNVNSALWNVVLNVHWLDMMKIRGHINIRFKKIKEKNQFQEQLLKDAQEYMDDILVKKISKEEAIVKYAEKNPQWITQNPNNIAIICDA
ncbi:3310_t:CDS:2, partial [Dentiscutata erythropus]